MLGHSYLLPSAHAAITTTAAATDAPPDYDDTIKKRISITGCNSGIGFDAAQRMVVRGHEVVLTCVSILYLEWFLYLYAMCVLLLHFQL